MDSEINNLIQGVGGYIEDKARPDCLVFRMLFTKDFFSGKHNRQISIGDFYEERRLKSSIPLNRNGFEEVGVPEESQTPTLLSPETPVGVQAWGVDTLWLKGEDPASLWMKSFQERQFV